MSRGIFAVIGSILLAADAILHLYRAYLPDGAFFSSPLHQQYMLYVAGSVVLIVGLLTAPNWLGSRAWLANLVTICWELGALGVWLLIYHGPEPSSPFWASAPFAKALEVLIIVCLLVDLRGTRTARLLPASTS